MKSEKILIVVPAQDQLGGVYNFYKTLKDYLDSDTKYFYVGSPKFLIKNKVIVFLIYLFLFTKILAKERPKKVVLNTSLNLNAVLRDSIYLLVAKIFRCDVTLFWRGWNFDNEKYLKFPFSVISFLLFKADRAIVLYSKIKQSLKELGYKREVYGLSTIVNDAAFENEIKIENKSKDFNLLFLSRVETYKGVIELLDAYVILKSKYPNFKLTIAGDGKLYDNVNQKISQEKIKDVDVLGYVVGSKKYQVLTQGSVFVFPSYSEGMPNAVLEAMAIGLPIVTTPVGGLNDFFEEGKMGCFVKIKDVDSIVIAIEKLYLDYSLRKSISENNIEYARSNFRGEMVYNKLKNVINK